MAADTAQDPLQEELIEALKFLHAAVANSRLYGSAHPESARATQSFTAAINEVMAQTGPVGLVSGFDGLTWQGSPVTFESDDRKGIGRHLHTEGIASLLFSPGVSVDEITKLISILRMNLSLPHFEEETLELLLWQAEFTHVGFRAVSALMDAEALSGRESDGKQDSAEDEVQRILDLNLGMTEEEQRNLRRLIGEDELRRAIDRNDVALANDDDMEEDERAWAVLMATEKDDAEALKEIRLRLTAERTSQVVARLINFLLRLAVARRKDVAPNEALDLARGAVDALYDQGDAVGIVSILDHGNRFLSQLAGEDPAAEAVLRDFYDFALPSMRVARLLLSMDPSVPVERHSLERLVALMPDDALLSMLQSTTRETKMERLVPFLEAVGEVAGQRLHPYLEQADRLRMEHAVPIIRLFRIIGTDEDKRVRRKLLRRPAVPVKTEALRWYLDDLPNDDVEAVIATLLDNQTSVREAAIAVLAKHRPRKAAVRLRDAIASERFRTLDSARKRDICVALARVEGDTAIELLHDLVRTKVPIFDRDAALSTVEAAAMALARSGSPRGLSVLRKESGAWMTARSSAAQKALQTLKTDG